jgi:hypothetical protein
MDFYLLPLELFIEILSFIENDSVYSVCCQVNKKWYEETIVIWKKFCRKRNFLEDEAFWLERGKDWKWILQTKIAEILLFFI